MCAAMPIYVIALRLLVLVGREGSEQEEQRRASVLLLSLVVASEAVMSQGYRNGVSLAVIRDVF